MRLRSLLKPNTMALSHLDVDFRPTKPMLSSLVQLAGKDTSISTDTSLTSEAEKAEDIESYDAKPIKQTYLIKQTYRSFLQPRRHYTSAAWSTLPTPAIRVTDYLDNKVTLPFGVDFTITNPSYVTRPVSELREIHSGIGRKYSSKESSFRSPKDFVVFQPKRMAVQAVGVSVATEVKFEDEHEFIEICNHLLPSIQERITTNIRRFKEINDQYEAQVSEMTRVSKSAQADDLAMQHYLSTEKAVKSRFDARNIPSHMIEAHVKSIVDKIVHDDFVRKAYQVEVYNVVVDAISEEIKLRQLTPLDESASNQRQQITLLPQYQADSRHTRFIAGGIAAGKSSTAKRFAADLKARTGLSVADLAKISTDMFRTLLVNDPSVTDDIFLRASLTHDEARLMTEESCRRVHRKIKETGYAPHVLMETILPEEEEVELGTVLEGRASIDVTTCPPEKAVQRNFNRYNEASGLQKRLPATSSLLGSHQMVSVGVPKLASKLSGKDVVITIHNTDKSNQNTFIAIFDCQKDKMVIHDIHGMMDFVKKRHINTSASCPLTMFPHPGKISLKANIKQFLKDYEKHEIVFVDPSAKSNSNENGDEYSYAIFKKDKGLVITNPSLFEKILTEDPTLHDVFTALDSNVKSVMPSRQEDGKKPCFSPN